MRIEVGPLYFKYRTEFAIVFEFSRYLVRKYVPVSFDDKTMK